MTDELIEILAKCKADIGFHAQIFHPERFSRPFSRSHYELFEAINDKKVQKIATVAHRGWGKTSIFNFAIPSQYIAFHDSLVDGGGFVVPVSATASSAILQAENLKRELLVNPMYRTIFGQLKTDDTFSKESWITNTNVLVMPRGAEQQIRGLLYRNSRPQLLIPDDIENSEAVNSIDQRVKMEDWFMTDLANSVDRSSEAWRILMVGTILHESSLLSKIREDKTWTVFNFPLCDEEYKSFWPGFMSNEKCKELAEEYRSHHKIEKFYMEYMNVANPAEDATFKSSMFKYYEEGEVDFTSWELDHIVLLDPAKTEKVHNDFTAIIGVSIDTIKNKIYVRDVVNKHLLPEQIYEETFAMADRIGARTIGFEITGLNEFIRQPMKDFMFSKGKTYELVELKARTASGGNYYSSGVSKGKASRVAQLAPYYRMGWIYHNKHSCGVLEGQLLAFPRPKHWDAMDAFSYVIEMMEMGERFMSDETTQAEYDDLEKEQNAYDRLMEDDEPAVIMAGRKWWELGRC